MLFSPNRMRPMAQRRDTIHPSMVRLQEAAASVQPPVGPGSSAIAEWLGVSPQLATNWGRIGVSKNGALAAQQRSGYSATWILKGEGPKLMREASQGQLLPSPAEPPAGPRKGDVLKAMTADEEALMDEVLEYFRHMRPSDRIAMLKKLAELAELGKVDRAEFMREYGITGIMEKAANAVRRSSESAVVSPRSRAPALNPDEPELPHMPPPYPPEDDS